jgi:hypothetical protein
MKTQPIFIVDLLLSPLRLFAKDKCYLLPCVLLKNPGSSPGLVSSISVFLVVFIHLSVFLMSPYWNLLVGGGAFYDWTGSYLVSFALSALLLAGSDACIWLTAMPSVAIRDKRLFERNPPDDLAYVPWKLLARDST